jgi:hypothetical protein
MILMFGSAYIPTWNRNADTKTFQMVVGVNRWRSSLLATRGQIHRLRQSLRHPPSSDPISAISAGFLVLSGPTVLVRLREAQEGFWHRTKYVLETGGKEVDFKHDCDSDFEDGSLVVEENLLSIRLGPLYCLVLKQVV